MYTSEQSRSTGAVAVVRCVNRLTKLYQKDVKDDRSGRLFDGRFSSYPDFTLEELFNALPSLLTTDALIFGAPRIPTGRIMSEAHRLQHPDDNAILRQKINGDWRYPDGSGFLLLDYDNQEGLTEAEVRDALSKLPGWKQTGRIWSPSGSSLLTCEGVAVKPFKVHIVVVIPTARRAKDYIREVSRLTGLAFDESVGDPHALIYLSPASYVEPMASGRAAPEFHPGGMLDIELPAEELREARPSKPFVADGDEQAMLVDALAAIEPSDDLTWRTVGMGLKVALGEDDGWDVFDAWSARNPESYDASENLSRWKSFTHEQGEGVGAASIFYLAQQSGWTHEAWLLSQMPVYDAPGVLRQQSDVTPETDCDPDFDAAFPMTKAEGNDMTRSEFQVWIAEHCTYDALTRELPLLVGASRALTVVDRNALAEDVKLALRDACDARVGIAAVRNMFRTAVKANAPKDLNDRVLDRGDPDVSAREFVLERYPTLISWLGECFEWTGSHYKVIDPGVIKREIDIFLNKHFILVPDGETFKKVPFTPVSSDVNEVVNAIQRMYCKNDTLLTDPSWLSNEGNLPPAEEFISFPNGLLHYPTRVLYPQTKDYFTRNALTFHYDAAAKCPQWHDFHASLWDDAEQRQANSKTMQESFGYLMTRDLPGVTGFQKIPLWVGESRSGKGTHDTILRKLLGVVNVATMTLGALVDLKGLQPLIGKRLAVFPDLHVGKFTDIDAATGRLKELSGGDICTNIPRKYLTDWEGVLSVRFLMVANTLPTFSDASKAFANRLVPVPFEKSFEGQEDLTLALRLEGELAGIFNWALDGWKASRGRGSIYQSPQSLALRRQMMKLSSPVAEFAEDGCVIDPAAKVIKTDLYAAYRQWCKDTGRDHPLTLPVFTKALKSALPQITEARGKSTGLAGAKRVNVPYYLGVRQATAFDAADSPELPETLPFPGAE